MKTITYSAAFHLFNLENTYDDLYFLDINALVHSYQNSVVIVDLTNAMKTGKTCTRWLIRANPWKMESTHLCMTGYLKVAFPDCSTVFDLVQALRSGDQPKEADSLTIDTCQQPGNRTFSPFVTVNPVKLGERLNAATIAKAICSGQITAARTDGRYTDDYAADAANDFYRGEIDLVSFASDIYEHPSGWRFWWKNGGKAEIVAACHTFDYKTLTVA